MKALIITGKLVQDHEFIYPYYRMQEAGFTVDVATPDGKDVIGSLGTKIPANKCFEEAYKIEKETGYDVMIIPGGAKCMEYIRQDLDLLDFINKFNATGKTIASICHAGQMLISAKIVKGRRISGYYSIKDDINNAGAEYIDAPVVVDSNIVSCPHYKYLGEWMKRTLEVINNHASR